MKVRSADIFCGKYAYRLTAVRLPFAPVCIFQRLSCDPFKSIPQIPVQAAQAYHKFSVGIGVFQNFFHKSLFLRRGYGYQISSQFITVIPGVFPVHRFLNDLISVPVVHNRSILHITDLIFVQPARIIDPGSACFDIIRFGFRIHRRPGQLLSS